MKRDKAAFSFRGRYLLLIVFFCYVGFFFVNTQTALLALKKSGAVLMTVLPIFFLVILLTALFNYFLQPRQIARHIGRESGLRAWMWALAAGVISHGPMYAWYPMLEDLRGHGMRNGLIVTFFASRVIKVPLLPMMVDYFGWTFTLVVSLYVLIGALIQGWLFERLQRDTGEKLKVFL